MLQEILNEEYPTQGVLKDGTPYTIRLLRPEDASSLYRFFSEIPRNDRLFLRDDVQDKSVIEGWCTNMDLDLVIPLVAEVDHAIAGEASLHRERRGWMSHIGKVRMVIHPAFRRKGLALSLMKEIINIGLHTGSLERLNAECMDTQTEAIWMCENAGFVRRAVLPGQVRDIEGRSHDLVVLTYELRDQEFHALD
jgi:RimJ/RimL family protein N-acetyltransferase